MSFVQKEITDTQTQILDSTVRLIMQLLVQWKSNVNSSKVNSLIQIFIYFQLQCIKIATLVE